MVEKSKYKSFADWRKKNKSAYQAALKLGMTNAIMLRFGWNKPKQWNAELAMEDALKYSIKSEWIKKSSRAYETARKLGILPECCAHMKKNIKWTNELLKKEALKYSSKKEWDENSPVSIIIARRRGVLEECCKHMISKIKPKGYWTLEKCKEEALKYNNSRDWEKNSNGSYLKAMRLGILKECCYHMTKLRCEDYWTHKLCKEDAFKYSSRRDWVKQSPSAYRYAYKEKIVDKCCSHMKRLQRPNGYWSLERCLEEAKKYKTKVEWHRNSGASYVKASNNKWLEECTQHMK